MTTSQSASDRRVVVLQVTEEGLKAAKPGTRSLKNFTEALLSGLSPERRRDLSDSLRVIYDAATDYLEDFLQRGALSQPSRLLSDGKLADGLQPDCAPYGETNVNGH